MNLLRSHKLSILLFLFSSVLAHSAPRTYVSVNGSDGNTGIGCPSTSPCRSFGAALGVTDIYGEVVAIDSGDYPQVTVTQSATLKAAPGVDATIFAPWGDGVTITVGGGDIVVLRGLNVNGLNFGSSGIRFTAGGVLKVENCNLANFNNNGISMEAAGTLFVKDTEVQNAFWGIRLQSPAGLIHASIDGVHLEHGFTGVFAGENSQTTLRNSVVADYTYTAVNAGDYTGAIELNLEGCLIQGSYTGIVSSGGGGGGTVIVRVSHSTITDNGLGLSSFSASLLSYGNNRLAGNSSDGSFTGLISLQ